MRVDYLKCNPALSSIFDNPNQMITLDANFLIPPDRSRYTKRGIDFSLFRAIWLDPIFNAFPMLAIHEAVHDELVMTPLRKYIATLLEADPPRLIIHTNTELSDVEKVLFDTIELKIYPHTRYDPTCNNKDDRGEVKSLAFIATKGLIYFAAHDYNALMLIEKAQEWSTGLDNIRAIQMYEIIYYLYVNRMGNNNALRMLFKYQYYLTDREKYTNPEWREFISAMNSLYMH